MVHAGRMLLKACVTLVDMAYSLFNRRWKLCIRITRFCDRNFKKYKDKKFNVHFKICNQLRRKRSFDNLRCIRLHDVLNDNIFVNY